MNDTAHEPLVSIIVITYNSSNYVLEALESAKAQTYKHIELIISDDGSDDSTLDICMTWSKDNSARFRRIEVLKAPANTGIPANCNRAFRASNGEWIKYIAGDDLLLPTCVQTFVECTVVQPQRDFFCSAMYVLRDDLVTEIWTPPHHFFKGNARKQTKLLLKFLAFILSPALFLRRATLESLGLFDEEYRGFEDYPFYLRASQRGHLFTLVPEATVVYRVHPNNTSRASGTPFWQSLENFHEEVAMPMMAEEGMWLWYRHYRLQRKLRRRKTILLSWWIRLTDPIAWYKKWRVIATGRPFNVNHTVSDIEPTTFTGLAVRQHYIYDVDTRPSCSTRSSTP